jgi:16S rRNA (cytosine1402-N4)-methyltransferase
MSAVRPHRSVLLDEAVAALAIRSEGVILDSTFGRGGHSRAILNVLGPTGRLLAMDRDPAAIAAGKEIDDPRFTLVHAWFGELDRVLDAHAIHEVDGVLMDLGGVQPSVG